MIRPSSVNGGLFGERTRRVRRGDLEEHLVAGSHHRGDVDEVGDVVAPGCGVGDDDATVGVAREDHRLVLGVQQCGDRCRVVAEAGEWQFQCDGPVATCVSVSIVGCQHQVP